MPSKRSVPHAVTVAFLTGLYALMLAACASATPKPSANDEPGQPGGSVGSVGSAGSASASSAVTASVTGHPPTPVPDPNPSGCRHATGPITIQVGTQPDLVCLLPGETLTLTAPTSPAQPWQPATVSDPATLSCTSHSLPDGALTVTCHARTSGTATVTTTTAPFAGDPHGPPQFIWTLTVHIQDVLATP